MGFFDFLNPKKAVQNKLAGAVEDMVMDEVDDRLGGITSEPDLRDKLQGLIEEKMQEQAAQIIPSALESASDSLIRSAAEGLTAKMYDPVAKKVLPKGQAQQPPPGGQTPQA